MAAVFADAAAVGGATVVTIAGVTVNGLERSFDSQALDIEETNVSAGFRSVDVQSGSLPALAIGVAAVVDGTAMRVTDFRAVDNGIVTRIDFAISGTG